MNSKFKLTDETLEHEGHTLHRIVALKDFGDVKKGDIGGWVESEKNLSSYHTCWIYDNAKAYGEAVVSSDAKMHDESCIYDFGSLSDDCEMFDQSKIYGYGRVPCCAKLYDTSVVCESGVFASGRLRGTSKVYGKADIAFGDLDYVDQDIYSDHATEIY